ncbi:MAG: DUF924 domain-containing protein [Rhodobacteraceae bacterium]|nr:DUF924 domain-containing protein [Paracoccaceae bacterium]
MTNDSTHLPQDVLDLWFPDTGHQNSPETHGAFWDERMQGGMDATIIDRFADLTLAAAIGQLDHWADTPRGRLALLIALDQFPRSLWRDMPATYAQDIKAARLALEGIKNGDIDGLEPWEMTFFVIAIAHCEGPEHLQRMHEMTGLVEKIITKMPDTLSQFRDGFRAQHERVTNIIATYGRHPHRNKLLGRASSAAEEEYIATGDFPHLKKDH